MTNAKEGIELTRVGPGTMMGDLMRHYWIPAFKSSELVRDGDPVRIMLLGEKLIGFRDSDGRVGVMDHRCPHRCASLFLGRNEEKGIRCVYHGWKFDVEGNCVDMPSAKPHQDFKHKVRAKAYKAAEKAGVVWVYMGTAKEPPPLPGFEILDVPEEEINLTFIMRDCNYLQALEGEIDTSHFGFLHAGHVDPENVDEAAPLRQTVADRAPEYHVSDAPWGTQYAGYRASGEDQTYWRFANFLFPFWTQAPNGEFGNHMHARAWVPLDDTHTMFVFIWWKKAVAANSQPQPVYKDGTLIGGTGRTDNLQPNSTDWLGRFRLVANESNDWQIDRESQRDSTNYTGIEGVHLQDQAITESMGGIVEHDLEHLAPSDLMIARTRRRMLIAMRALRNNGELPPGAEDPSVYRNARGGYMLTDETDDSKWRTVYETEFQAGAHP